MQAVIAADPEIIVLAWAGKHDRARPKKDLFVPSVTETFNTENTEISVTSVLAALGTEITEFLKAGTGQL